MKTIYHIECSYCRKIFKRQKLDYSLKTHKDSHGNPCYGRNGYLKNTTYEY